jgi:hypothetical protein
MPLESPEGATAPGCHEVVSGQLAANLPVTIPANKGAFEFAEVAAHTMGEEAAAEAAAHVALVPAPQTYQYFQQFLTVGRAHQAWSSI